MDKTKTHQELMDSAYDKWQNEWKEKTKSDFYFSLPVIERKAVVLGNFNYQVCNGGFGQWAGNGYMELHISELKEILNAIGSENALSVRKLVIVFEREYQEDSEEYPGELDYKYYEINDTFMKECEEYLIKLQEEVRN